MKPIAEVVLQAAKILNVSPGTIRRAESFEASIAAANDDSLRADVPRQIHGESGGRVL